MMSTTAAAIRNVTLRRAAARQSPPVDCRGGSAAIEAEIKHPVSLFLFCISLLYSYTHVAASLLIMSKRTKSECEGQELESSITFAIHEDETMLRVSKQKKICATLFKKKLRVHCTKVR